MPALIAPDLLGALEQVPLLTDAQMREVRQSLIGRYPGATALAGELSRRGWLTKYQLDRLREGEGRHLVLGAYRILDPLGHGGMGEVYKARHALLGRTVAVKLIRPELVRSMEAVRRFRLEIRAGARLGHRNVVVT